MSAFARAYCLGVISPLATFEEQVFIPLARQHFHGIGPREEARHVHVAVGRIAQYKERGCLGIYVFRQGACRGNRRGFGFLSRNETASTDIGHGSPRPRYTGL
jgi:hypothetical protein